MREAVQCCLQLVAAAAHEPRGGRHQLDGLGGRHQAGRLVGDRPRHQHKAPVDEVRRFRATRGQATLDEDPVEPLSGRAQAEPAFLAGAFLAGAFLAGAFLAGGLLGHRLLGRRFLRCGLLRPPPSWPPPSWHSSGSPSWLAPPSWPMTRCQKPWWQYHAQMADDRQPPASPSPQYAPARRPPAGPGPRDWSPPGCRAGGRLPAARDRRRQPGRGGFAPGPLRPGPWRRPPGPRPPGSDPRRDPRLLPSSCW